MDKTFSIRLSLVRELSSRRVTLEEFEKMLQAYAKELDGNTVKLVVADLVIINNDHVELSKDGKLLLELIR